MFLTPASRPGYIFLITVLVIGAIATTTAVTLVLLGLASEQTGLTLHQSAQAYEHAQTCAERTIRSLRSDLTYTGSETFVLTNGTCAVEDIAGTGNDNRIICVEGRSGRTVRRFEIVLREVYPSVKVASWTEVSAFSLCP